MRRGFWTDFGFPATTVLLAGFGLYHFTVGHGADSATPAAAPAPLVPPRLSAAWPPAPDTTALGAVRLPVRAPFALLDTDSLYGLPLRYDGELVLDAAGLTLEIAGGSEVRSPDADPAFALDSLVLAIAEPHPSGWRIVAQSAPWTEGGAAAPRAPYRIPTSLSIAGLTAMDLAGRWPVLIHVLDRVPPVDPGGGIYESHQRHHHHGDRGVFDQMLAGTHPEVRR
jgi:hypothetical protein